MKTLGLGLGIDLGRRKRLSPDPAPPGDDRYGVFVTSDMDSAPGEERDDNAGYMILLAAQDRLRLEGIIADAPSGLASAYPAMFAAYGQDRAKLASYHPDGETRYLSEAALNALVSQGRQTDNNARGYMIPTDGSGYDSAHAAAQRLIQAAEAYDPDGTFVTNPRGKLWVLAFGGYVTLAQAAYEAIVLGQMPDFLKRIVHVGYYFYNSAQTGSAWDYLNNNCWQAENEPGLFGDLQMINGLSNFTPLDEDTPANRAVWSNYVVPAGAMGTYLNGIRATSGYPNPYWRAGDACNVTFLLDCIDRDEFDPAVPGNMCGVFRTYDDGVGRESPSRAYPKWSPTWYAPLVGVINGETAISIGGSSPARFLDLTRRMVTRYGQADTAIYDYERWDGPFLYEFDDPARVVTDAGGNITGAVNRMWRRGDLYKLGSAGTLQIAPDAMNGRAVARLTPTPGSPGNSTRLRLRGTLATEDPSRMFQGEDKPFTLFTVWRALDEVSLENPWSAGVTISSSSWSGFSYVRRVGSASGFRRNPTGTTTLNVPHGDAAGTPTNSIRVQALRFNGQSIDFWDTSLTPDLVGAPCDTGAISTSAVLHYFVQPVNSSTNPTFANNQGAMELALSRGVDRLCTDAEIAQAITDMATKYGAILE